MLGVLKWDLGGGEALSPFTESINCLFIMARAGSLWIQSLSQAHCFFGRKMH